jgi:phosphoribosyl-ATP pyrophosphohydrolase
MGYHLTEIERGEYGEFSKIREEFLEAEDAIEQGNKVMLLVELADLIGAIEGYCTKHNITLDDLITMKEVTKRAFSDGTRTPRTNEKGT